MFSFFNNWSTAKRRHQPLLRIQELNERIVPAGLIDVTFQNGLLQINGDAANNTLSVSQAADGRLTLNTDIGTALRVNKTDVSGFMGYTLSSPVIGGVTVNMGAGADSLTFTGLLNDLDLPSSVTINNGDGDNLLTIQQGVTIGGDLTITNGVGLDTTHFFDEFNVLGKVTINNGNGGSLLDSNATGNLNFAGNLTVNSGVGLDKIDLNSAQGVTLAGFTIKTGTDANGSETKLGPVQSLTINGNVNVTNGAGSDSLDIGDGSLVTKITGSVSINNGAGSNHTDIFGTNSLFVGGATTVIGGANEDLVHLGLNSNLVSFGAITINSGPGNSGINITGTELSVNGNLTVTGGIGADSFSVLSNQDGMINGSVKVNLGGGQNTYEMKADNNATFTVTKTLNLLSNSNAGVSNIVSLHGLKVQGATSITTGDGNDSIAIDDSTFNGSFTLSTRAGADTINIEQFLAYTGHTQFNLAMQVNTGSGDDKVFVSGVVAEAERKTIFCASAKFDGGMGTDTLQLSAFGSNYFYGSPAVKLSF